MGKIRQLLAAVDADDLFFFGGLALVSYGGWLAYPPAGYVLGGIGLLYLATRG